MKSCRDCRTFPALSSPICQAVPATTSPGVSDFQDPAQGLERILQSEQALQNAEQTPQKTDQLQSRTQRISQPPSFRELDIGLCRLDGHDRRFLVSSGIGFDAAVCHEAESSRIKPFLNHLRLGKLTYLGIALKNIFKMSKGNVVIRVDHGEEISFSGILFAAAMNLPFEGGGFAFCPNADPSDGMIDICLIESMPVLRILRLLPTAFRGAHVRYTDVVHLYRCRSITLTSVQPLTVHTDGEPHGTGCSFTAEITGEKLRMI
ncbi:MAG: diacylglycerol kinase family lipid kinase [Eubacteriales bacterium]|nr:diacylglycerol kinase family lipid kinase [Eubacteriales bacterium]